MQANALMRSALRSYWSHTNDIVFVKDMAGAYVGASEPLARLYGYARGDDFIGKTDAQLIPDQELARRYAADDARVLESGAPMEKRVEPLYSADGKRRYGLTCKYILRDDTENPVGLLGVCRDVTHAYEREDPFSLGAGGFFDLPADAPLAALIDVSAWRVLDIRVRDASGRVRAPYDDVDAYLRDAAYAARNDDAARAFYEGLTKDALEKRRDRGEGETSIEYLRAPKGETPRWVRCEARFLTEPASGGLTYRIVLRDIDDARRAYAELLRAAQRDDMTELLNRAEMRRRIEAYLAQADPTRAQALFMIDLDNFKLINDTFGHPYGDSVIKDAAAAIREVFSGADIVARIGGDEFMALMKDAGGEINVRRRAEILLDTLQFLARDRNKALRLTSSVGVTLFRAGERGFDALYREADTAMYRAKKHGKNQYALYRPDETEDRETAADEVDTVHLRTLLQYMDGGVLICEVGDDVRVTYVSPSMISSLIRMGVSADDAGADMFALIAPTDLPMLKRAMTDAARDDTVMDCSYRVTLKNGVGWQHIRAKRLPRAQGGANRMIAVVTDITHLKKTEEQLREAETRYRVAIEQTGTRLWEVDIPARALRFPGVSGRAERLYENAPESYVALGRVHPESVPDFLRMYEDIYAGREGEDYFLKMRDEDGQEEWIRSHYRLLKNDRGEAYRALGVTVDAPGKNAQMRLFEQEARFAEITRGSLLGYFRANLTQNRLLRAETELGSEAPGSYDDYRTRVALSRVYPEDAPEFLTATCRDALTQRMNAGEQRAFADFRRVGADGKTRWVCLFIKLMRHPISGDLYLFGYLCDNETNRRRELSLPAPPERVAPLYLFSPESAAALSRRALEGSDPDALCALSVVKLSARGGAPTDYAELASAFGRLCRIMIGGDVIIGQADEQTAAILRMGAGSAEAQRERVVSAIAAIRGMLERTHPEAGVQLIGGYAVERAGSADYELLLRKARLACRSVLRALGESSVAYADPGIDEAEDVNLAQRLSSLETRYQRQAELLRLSENDELTGLCGKRAFYMRVRAILDAEPDASFAIVRFDINRFKVYNDVATAAAGDRLLRGIAAALLECAGATRATARLEADHFALLMPDDPEAIERSLDALSKWLAAHTVSFRLTCSVGVYRVADRAQEVSLMCDRALLALKSVKTGFENRLGYYDERLRLRLLEEQTLMDECENALESGQFELYYQPQINYEDGSVVGAEALVRWNHPARGLLPPGAFIPLFEQNGFIARLDAYVWTRCCEQMRSWLDRCPDLALPGISVNLSRHDLYQADLADRLLRAVEKHGLPPSALRLEITESAYMENPRQLIETVGQLRAAGFFVEMDDFGSGYSSLNTLKDVVVDGLKLDMKFLADCEDNARAGNILCSVIRMAHWLKLPVIAEGVERYEQAEYLKSLSCLRMQGYYFARPMKAEAFFDLLKRSRVSERNPYGKTRIEGVTAFWDPSAQTALLFNSFVGGAAIVEYVGGAASIVRANDRFLREIETTREAYLPKLQNTLARFTESSAADYREMLEEASRTGDEAERELESLPHRPGDAPFWTHTRARLLAVNGDTRLYYLSVENINRRKRAENALLAEKQKTDLAMLVAGLTLWTYDIRADRFTLARNNMGPFETGDDIEGAYRTVLRLGLVMPDSRETYQRLHESVRSGETTASAVIHFDPVHCPAEWMKLTYAPIPDESGVSVAVAVGQDVTAQKRAEDRYRQEIEYRKTLGNDCIMTLRVNLTHDAVEDMQSVVLPDLTFPEGTKRDGIVPVIADRIENEAERARFMTFFSRESMLDAFARGTTELSLRYRARAEHGGKREMKADLRLLQRPGDGAVVAFVAIRDVTTEALMTSIMRKLIEASYDYVACIESDGSFRLFAAGRDQTALPASGDSFERSAAETAARFTDPEDVSALLESVRLARVRDALQTSDEYVCAYRSSPETGARARRLVFRTLDTDARRILLTRQDVTELLANERESARKLESALAQARSANDAKSDFLSRMSHDIRTPLSAVIGLTALALENPASPDTEGYLRKIDVSGRYLQGLLSDILDMSKIERRVVELRRDRYEYGEFISTLVAIFEPLCREKGVTLRIRRGDARFPIRTDRVRFNQIFFNILSNAVKFTPPGGSVEYAEVNGVRRGDVVSCDFIIRDTGRGIDPDFLPHIYEPFSQEKRAEGKNEGSGLGLSVAKSIVELMGGALEISSEPGRGTEARIHLDLTIDDDPPRAQADTENDAPLAGARVLLCEDMPINALICRRMLEKAGARVSCAENGKIALERFGQSAEGEYQAILMDIFMPEMDGLEAARAIRALTRKDAARVPIVALSANAFEIDRERSRLAGMNAHLSKPVDRPLLLRTLEKLIKDYRAGAKP